jgi:DNA-binding MarR family transcriptional regulator
MAVGVRARDPVVEAWELIGELFAAHRPRLVALARELELTPPQMWALRRLELDEPAPMSELARGLFCDASNVTGLVDRLEARGLVERRAVAHDRRVKALALTEAGAEVRRRISEVMDEPPAPLARLPAADRRALRDILRRAMEAGTPRG